MKAKAYNLVNSVVQEEMDAGLLAEIFAVEARTGRQSHSHRHLPHRLGRT